MTGRYTGVARWVKSRRRTLIAFAALLFTGMGVALGTLSLRRGDQVLLAYVASAGNNHVQIIDLSSGRTLRNPLETDRSPGPKKPVGPALVCGHHCRRRPEESRGSGSIRIPRTRSVHGVRQ
jgi:hypothetical protein